VPEVLNLPDTCHSLVVPRVPLLTWSAVVSWINGSDAILAQRLRLHREIAYRDFGVFVVIVHETRETPIPDSPMKPPVYTWMVPISA
jgi:hypothetical protein